MREPFTTDLVTIRANPSRFTWGTVKAIVDVGPYTFVQYETEERQLWHVYIDEKDSCRGGESLEQAMVAAIAQRNGHRNDGAEYCAWKLLKKETA
jgi:hypothetical protein